MMNDFMLRSEVDAMSTEEQDAVFDRVMNGLVKVVDELPNTIPDPEFCSTANTLMRDDRAAERAEAYAKAAENLSVADMSKLSGAPAAMFCIVEGKPYIKSAGLMYIADKKGVRSIETEVVETEGGYMATAKVYPNWSREDIEIIKAAHDLPADVQRDLISQIGRPFIGVGTATLANTNGKTSKYLREMAITRAVNSALRLYTAYGFCTVEELKDYVPSEDEDFAASRRV